MADTVRFSGARELKQRATHHLRKFVFDFAINHSLQSPTGRKQVHKILQEEVAVLPSLSSSSSKNKICEFAEATNAIEKLQEVPEDRDKLKQHSQISMNSGEGSEVPKGEPGEDIKRIFIRSRL